MKKAIRLIAITMVLCVWCAGQAMSKTTTVITPAQLATLANTPVVVVPAPGVGKTTVVFRIMCQLKFGTAAYNPVAAPDKLRFSLDNPFTFGKLAASTDDLSFMTLTESAINTASLVDNIYSFDTTAHASNQPLYAWLQLNAPGDELRDGDGQLIVTVWYMTYTIQ